MASAWGSAWGNAWGNAWGAITGEPVGRIFGKRRRFHVRRDDKIYIFDSLHDAQLFERQLDQPEPKKKTKKKSQLKLVKPVETVSITETIEKAPNWAQELLNRLIAQAEYERLIKLIRELEEEEETELLLLSL